MYLFIIFRKEDDVYNIKIGIIKLVNQTFNKSKNDYEIILNNNAWISDVIDIVV